MKKPLLIVITGPTASGKSALAVSLAKTLNTQIISADSRQIYKGIPIVSAVPTPEERENIPHHLLEVLPLDAYYSAAKFSEDSNNILKNIFKTSEFAIVCGGSMLYIDSLVNGIDELPTVPPEIRNNLMKRWQINGDNWLVDYLKQIDPQYYCKADLKNLKRVFHAVEVSETAGQPYSGLLTGGKSQPSDSYYRVLKFCLSGPRENLFDRINRRVVSMMHSGLEKEAASVYHLRHLNSLNTVGLKEMFAYFDGILSREDAVARIQKNTRVYAKKQMTWHKRDDKILQLDFTQSIAANTEKILRQIKNHIPH